MRSATLAEKSRVEATLATVSGFSMSNRAELMPCHASYQFWGHQAVESRPWRELGLFRNWQGDPYPARKAYGWQ
jgi:hypothetical protein